MENKTKIILSIIGICAVAIPVALLILLTKKTDVQNSLPAESRPLDQSILNRIINSNNQSGQMLLPTPSPTSLPIQSSSGAVTLPQGTGSAF